jgi:hypothetical protein
MRKIHPTLARSLTVLLLVFAASAAFGFRYASYRFTPPAEPGVIYTVINFDRAGGRAQATYVNIVWGTVRRQIVVAAPYHTCAETPASGFVLKLRHPRPDSVPLTLSTTGTVVHGPYQGDVPLELLSACYRIQT